MDETARRAHVFHVSPGPVPRVTAEVIEQPDTAFRDQPDPSLRPGQARGSRGLTDEMRQLSQKTGLWLLPGFPDTGAARPLRGIVGAGQRENGAL
jgi:hypothetical protein